MFDAQPVFFDLNSSFKQELMVGKGCASCCPGHAVKIHTWWQMQVHISCFICKDTTSYEATETVNTMPVSTRL